MHFFKRNPVALVALIGLGVVGWTGCGRASTQPPFDAGRRVDLDLGTIPPGSQASGSLRMANSSTQTWRIAQIESSCPCLRVVPDAFEAKPGRSIAVRVVCDLGAEPDFQGKLLIDVKGLDANGIELCNAQVAVAVQNGPPSKIVLTR